MPDCTRAQTLAPGSGSCPTLPLCLGPYWSGRAGVSEAALLQGNQAQEGAERPTARCPPIQAILHGRHSAGHRLARNLLEFPADWGLWGGLTNCQNNCPKSLIPLIGRRVVPFWPCDPTTHTLCLGIPSQMPWTWFTCTPLQRSFKKYLTVNVKLL